MILCTVKDANGEIMGTFHPKGEKNLIDEAADVGLELPFSCHAGACMTCATKIISGHELIDAELDGPKYLETEQEVELSCISGVKKEFADSADEYELVIQMLG